MTPLVPGWLGWPIRVTAFAIVGLLTFMLPSGATALQAQFAGYLVAGAGLLAWALVDLYPRAARYRARVLPVALGVVAAAAGFVTTAGHYENSCADMMASMATTGAGLLLGLSAAWMITGVSMLAMEANWLIYHDGSTQISNLLLQPLVPLAGLLIGRILYGRRVQAEQSAALLDRTQQLLAEQGRADVLSERARIAREIHDVLAHSLGALGIQIQAARAVLTDHEDIGRAVEILTTAQRMAADGLVVGDHHAQRRGSRRLAHACTSSGRGAEARGIPAITAHWPPRGPAARVPCSSRSRSCMPVRPYPPVPVPGPGPGRGGGSARSLTTVSRTSRSP